MTRCNILSFGCPCGEKVTELTAAGLTERGQIVFFWTCPSCKNACQFASELDALKDDCPIGHDLTIKDIAWLHNNHISPPPNLPEAP